MRKRARAFSIVLGCLSLFANQASAEEVSESEIKSLPEKSALPARASLDRSASMFDRYMEAGQNAAGIRADQLAETKLLDAIREAKKPSAQAGQLIKARLALADVYLKSDKFIAAGEIFQQCMPIAKRYFGEESKEYAHCLHGVAAVSFYQGKYLKAEPMILQAAALRKKLFGENSHELGESLIIHARIQGALGWKDDAHFAMINGLEVLHASPGPKSLDLADGLREAALFYHSQGKLNRSRELFELSYSLKDKAVNFEQPPNLQGSVNFKWEDGSPRSQEFTDADFPLKYLASNQVRVSCTIVDLWELLGILICVTNIGDKKVDIGLGAPSLTELKDPYRPLPLISENSIDHRRRERTMWDMTYNKPWLANIQKTRTVRGFVSPKGHDMYRGPNIFGIYGKWGGTQRILPPEKFMLNRSPEGLEEQAEAVVEEDLIHSRNKGAFGLVSVTLEPFESRTGELFYLNPRKEELLLKVPVGNTIFEFPFHAPRRRIPQ